MPVESKQTGNWNWMPTIKAIKDDLEQGQMTANSAATDGDGATEGLWHCTCAPTAPNGRQAFSAPRVACTPEELRQRIEATRGDDAGARSGVALIMPSSFHLRPTIHKELPNGAEMLLYCGIADLDAEPRHAGSKEALKAEMKNVIGRGSSVQEAREACPDFGNVIEAALVMCAKLREKGVAPICWFTGGKGVRVAWLDPACYMRYRKGDKDVSARVRDVFFKDYLGAECLAQIRALCELDKCVYDAGKGVKSDLRRHQDTGLWPFLIDLCGEGFRGMCSTARDEALCDEIVEFWGRVLRHLPASWNAANEVPGGAKAINDVEGRKRVALESSAAACTTKKAKTAQQTVNAAGKEHMQAKLEELAGALVQIHPSQCCKYKPWIGAFCAVNNDLSGARNADVHALLDAFSCIRDNYKGAGDVTQRYNQIQLRDESQSRVGMGTLVHLSRQHPALVMKTRPTAEECATVRAAGGAQLELLLSHVDPAKTDWRWLLQACACLVSDSEAFLVDHQRRITEQYAQVGVSIDPDAFKVAFQPPQSGVYRQALVEYIATIMEMQSLTRLTESDDEDDGLEARPAGASDAERVVKGRATQRQTAKLLVQLPRADLRQLLGGGRRMLKTMLKQHLRVPAERKPLMRALEACIAPLLKEGGSGQVEACCVSSAAVDDEDSGAQDGAMQDGDLAGSMMTDDDAQDGDMPDATTGQDSINVDAYASLQDVVTARGAMRFKPDWSTGRLTPYQMPEALVQNIAPDVDWRLVLVWTCLLIVYEAKHEAGRSEADKDAADTAAKNAAEPAAKNAADTAAAAAQKAAAEAAEKASVAEAALTRALKAHREAKNANTEARAQEAAAERAKCRRAQAKAADEAKAAEEAAARLGELQNSGNDHAGSASEEAGLPTRVFDPTLPDVLEDYLDMLQKLPASHGVDTVPSAQVFHAFWKRTHGCIVKNTRVQRTLLDDVLLLGGAVWSVCFDQMFSYQAVKRRFEQNHFRLADPMAFAKISSTGEMSMVSQSQLCAFHRNQFYWGHQIKPDCYSLDASLARRPFMNEWMKDQDARQFDRVDSIPPSRSGNTAPPGVYNLWPGFDAELLTPVDQEDVQDLVQPILDHLRAVVTGPDHLGFVVAWLAQLVQDAGTPTGVAIVLHGTEGAGKDIVFDFFIRKVLGARTAFKTANPAKDIFGDHSVALQNRVFVLVDEASGDVMRAMKERFKDLITSKTVHVNPKNEKAYDIRNQANMLLTSNQQNPVQIDPQERRFVVFECNASKKGDTEYFQKLAAHLERDDVARAFFQHLRDFDVRPYTPFQSHRPQTEAYAAMQQRNIPLFYKFLSAQADHKLGTSGLEQVSQEFHERFLRNITTSSGREGNYTTSNCTNGLEHVRAKDFHERFMSWARDGNYTSTNWTVSRFGIELQTLMTEITTTDPSQSALKKTRGADGQRYTVHWRKLRDVLRKTKRYDPNAAG